MEVVQIKWCAFIPSVIAIGMFSSYIMVIGGINATESTHMPLGIEAYAGKAGKIVAVCRYFHKHQLGPEKSRVKSGSA